MCSLDPNVCFRRSNFPTMNNSDVVYLSLFFDQLCLSIYLGLALNINAFPTLV